MTPEQMEQRLKAQFEDAVVAVIDTTGTGDHFEVRINAKALQGLTRINQHKAVMAVFDRELKSGEVHALAIRVMNS